mmetsp:Transcript_14119/g.44369  ORF Transcript_14119/g.44369 Transcript_14119/m.44369 type:complete len:204 (-) Transcript_14119:126-737(-)
MMALAACSVERASSTLTWHASSSTCGARPRMCLLGCCRSRARSSSEGTAGACTRGPGLLPRGTSSVGLWPRSRRRPLETTGGTPSCGAGLLGTEPPSTGKTVAAWTSTSLISTHGDAWCSLSTRTWLCLPFTLMTVARVPPWASQSTIGQHNLSIMDGLSRAVIGSVRTSTSLSSTAMSWRGTSSDFSSRLRSPTGSDAAARS